MLARGSRLKVLVLLSPPWTPPRPPITKPLPCWLACLLVTEAVRPSCKALSLSLSRSFVRSSVRSRPLSRLRWLVVCTAMDWDRRVKTGLSLSEPLNWGPGIAEEGEERALSSNDGTRRVAPLVNELSRPLGLSVCLSSPVSFTVQIYTYTVFQADVIELKEA